MAKIWVMTVGNCWSKKETLSDLSISQQQNLPAELSVNAPHDHSTLVALPAKNIGPLLQQYCIDTQLYLQHDLSLSQLAKAIGTNRFYLSQYFSNQGTTYNAYINDLRINHLVSLYHDAVAAHRFVTAQQLSLDSGFHSYRTFTNAFKRKMGQSVTAWMKAVSKQEQSQARLDSADSKQARPDVKVQQERKGKP